MKVSHPDQAQYSSLDSRTEGNTTKWSMVIFRNDSSGMMLFAYNPSTWVVESGWLAVQSHPWLYKEFEASPGYIGTVSENTTQHKTNKLKLAIV